MEDFLPATDVTPPRSGVRLFRRSRLPMSVGDAFIYNVLAMGAIFPWVYVWGPTAFPEASLHWAFVLAFLAQMPISLAYSYLAAAFPVDAGDYEYQKRAFGRFGAVVVLSGFVVCILEWLPISGWLCATLGLAPLLLSAGVELHSRLLTKFGVGIESHGGVLIVSLLLNVAAVLLLVRGLRLFTTIQRWLFAFTLLALAVMGLVFLLPHALRNLNEFAYRVKTDLDFYLPVGLKSRVYFSNVAATDAGNYGYAARKADLLHRVLSTLGIVPIAWTSLQWATYSVEQNAEIEGAGSLRNQRIIQLLSPLTVSLLLLAVGVTQHVGLRSGFWRSLDAMNWSSTGSSGFVLFSTRILQPYPNVLAVASSGSLFFSFLISLGFVMNAFQISCNCFIGMGKIIGAMARDGILPRKLSELRDHPATGAPAPARAYWTYLILGIPVMVFYVSVPHWQDFGTSVVTVACGFVFCFSSLAAAYLPGERFRDSLSNSALKNVAAWKFRAAGCAGALVSFLMIAAYLISPRLFPEALGLRVTVPYEILAGIVAFSTAAVVLARSAGLLKKGRAPVWRDISPQPLPGALELSADTDAAD